jgi:hypothetical protein
VTAEHDFPGGTDPLLPDPLMAVITDEPLPEAAREDAGFLAEHRSAAADVALLREQLGIIGHALAEAPGSPAAEAAVPPVRRPSAPSRPSRPRRRLFALALGGLAVAGAATFVSGMAWLLTQAGGSSEGAAADKSAAQAGSKEEGGLRFGSPRYLVCARLVVEGTVTGLEPVPGAGQTRITLDVTRTYKPEQPGKSAADGDPLVFLVEDGVLKPLHVGDHALVGFPRQGVLPDALFTDEREIATERAWIVRSLPESRTLTCPGG